MNEDILELAYAVMLQAAEDAEADLKTIMEEIRRRNARLCHWRKRVADLQSHRDSADQELFRSAAGVIANQLAGLSDMSDQLTLRLQMAMDRRSKVIEALSNLLKKQSDTAAAIAGNLK